MKNKFKKEKYIRQRQSASTKMWEFQVYIRYVTGDGDKVCYTKTFSEKLHGSPRTAYLMAINDRDRFLTSLRNGVALGVKKALLRDVFEKSLLMDKLSVETIRKRKQLWARYVPNQLKEKDVKKIKPSDIQKTLVDAINMGATQEVVSRIFSTWKAVFKCALLQDLIVYDPCTKVSIPKSRNTAEKRTVTTDYETVKKVIEALRKRTTRKSENIFNTEIIIYSLWVMWFTGLRPAECYALERKHIDFENGIIMVRQSLGSVSRKEAIIRTTKTETSVRDIPITPSVEEILKSLMEFQDSDYLFANFNGELMSTRYVSAKITRVCKAEGIDFRRYNLRHQFATDILMNDTDVRTLQELMGHSSSSMSISYARSSRKMKENALKVRK